MELKKIYFDAYKSLLQKELEIHEKCIGFVGTNESGKSNLLYAIQVLSGERVLSEVDTPRMAPGHPPALRFEFKPSKSEIKGIGQVLKTWVEENTLMRRNLKWSESRVTYHVQFDRDKDTEVRYFNLNGLELDSTYLILKNDFIEDKYNVKTGDIFKPLNKAIIIRQSDLENDRALKRASDNIERVEADIQNLEDEVSVLKNELKEKNQEQQPGNENSTNEGSKPDPANNTPANNEFQQKQAELEALNQKKEVLEAKIDGFDYIKTVAMLQGKIDKSVQSIADLKQNHDTMKAKLSELEQIENPDEKQKNEIASGLKKVATLKTKIGSTENKRTEYIRELDTLRTPLDKKYTSDVTELNKHLLNVLLEEIESYLPAVVFWEHSKEYILESETQFVDILSLNSLDDVSRPLVNVFRIGLEVKSILELHSVINDTQKQGTLRSSYSIKLSRKVNEYIKSVWENYDQEIKISLEQEQIRIEIFDPKLIDQYYYNMDERSQGAQTFLSFLLTIGAEAKKGVIKNTILLLDEPETHLHPTGVRNMLRELIAIANQGNLVLYATHSPYMIDKENYDRHVILVKAKDQTNIKPSMRERIGYFMQEEVLYSTLDINLSENIASSNRYNFVFEGDADAILFECYYSNMSTKRRPYPIDSSSFYHGGKCSDIMKYLKHRPIQLGSKWIFVLDKDRPGNDLMKFIKSKYEKYMDTDIYVFQYDVGVNNEESIELEDLLPSSIITQSYQEVANIKRTDYENSKIEIMMDSRTYFSYNKKILDTLYPGEDINEIKGVFKAALNSGIREKVKEIKDLTSFKEHFPEYNTWVEKQLFNLRETERMKPKQKIARESAETATNGK